MKHTFLLYILLLTSCLEALTPTPYLATRSQGQDAVRDLIGLVPYINKEKDHFYGTFTITAEYTQSFFHNRIADNLFGDDLASDTLSAINLTGSAVEDRNSAKDWLADYFGLARDHNGTMRFEPVTSNYITDFYAFLGLNNFMQGLFATIHIPVVRTKWSLNFFEVINQDGAAFYPPGYFSPTALAEFTGVDIEAIGIKRGDLLNNASDFLFWQNTPAIEPTIFLPLQSARMAPEDICGHKVHAGVADIQTVIGWNFIEKRWCHLGIGLRTVIPLGTRPNGRFIFEPTIGNGRHWELGAQIWGHRTFCVLENLEKQWTAYFLIQITHMFNARQRRTFDLLCKPNSRWMLAEKFTSNVQNLQANHIPDNLDPALLITPDAQFAGIFAPVANLTSRNVKVRAAQCDAVFMLNYLKNHLSIDFGYNGWYRSCEKIKKVYCGPTPLTQNLWALKGDSYVYGFTAATGTPPVPNNTPVALSATQSLATIHGGTNNFMGLNGNNGGINGIRPTRNPGVDNAAFAAATFNGTPVFVNDRITVPPNLTDAEQTETSLNPIFIQEEQLDLCNATTKGFSNKIFFHLSYNFYTIDDCYIPYIGGGFALEIGNNNKSQCSASQGCQNSALSQMCIWLRGGFAFN